MNKYSKFSKSKQPKDEIFVPQATLDYHEVEITHHYQIEEELNMFLEDCIKAGFKKVLIITGKGKVVQPTVATLLKKHKLVANYKQAGYYNGQWGAFEVTLTSNKVV